MSFDENNVENVDEISEEILLEKGDSSINGIDEFNDDFNLGINNTEFFVPDIKETLSPEKKTKNTNHFAVICVIISAILVLISIFMFIQMPLKNSNEPIIDKSNSINIEIFDRGNRDINIVHKNGNDIIYSASDIYYNNIDSVVTIQTEVVTYGYFNQMNYGTAVGSGFIVTEDGYIITNYHVVEDGKTITVIMHNGDKYVAELIGYESDNDIAIIKINSDNIHKPVILGNSDNILIGEDVVAIGNPLGELTFSITKGIVSALSRTIQVDSENIISMFQVDCAVNEGNSGGPIFNMYGEVIGIVSAKYASDMIEGLGFCIPISDAIAIMDDLIEYGHIVDKAYIGITVTDVDSAAVQRYNMVEGAYIYSIDKDGPADIAGLRVGDIIVEIDGKPITSVNELLLQKRYYRANDIVSLKVWRSGEYIDVVLTFDVSKEIEDSSNNSDNQNKQYLPYNWNSYMNDIWNYYNSN